MARLSYADPITGERIANFYINHDWYEVYEGDERFTHEQCEGCGEADFTVNWDHLSGLCATLTCGGCGDVYYETIDPHEDATRAIKHLLAAR